MPARISDEAQGALRSAGLRATRQRVALLEVLLAARMPQSAEALSAGLKGSLNLTTTYRALAELVRAGLAVRVALPDGPTLYEASGTHHHHLICRVCGKMEDISICLPDDLLARVQKKSGFATVEDHSLEFFGLCTACARKAAKKG